MPGGVYCNRTLNMRSIRAIGYDMDYTLVDYQVESGRSAPTSGRATSWRRRAGRSPTLRYDHDAVIRGLIIDVERGNIVKANRHGFITMAVHGTRQLSFEELRASYMRTIVELARAALGVPQHPLLVLRGLPLRAAGRRSRPRSGARAGRLPRPLPEGARRPSREPTSRASSRPRIIADPARYVSIDPDLALTLIDQRHAGKKLLLITNSEWGFTRAMMDWVVGRALPGGMSWRELFDLVVVGARKPDFFVARNAMFEVVTEDGLARPVGGDAAPRAMAYLGGSAPQIERYLGVRATRSSTSATTCSATCTSPTRCCAGGPRSSCASSTRRSPPSSPSAPRRRCWRRRWP
jgi:hypothetical protein